MFIGAGINLHRTIIDSITCPTGRMFRLINELPANATFTGGEQYAQDYQEILKTAGDDNPVFPGMRLVTTVASGAELGAELWDDSSAASSKIGITYSGDGVWTKVIDGSGAGQIHVSSIPTTAIKGRVIFEILSIDGVDAHALGKVRGGNGTDVFETGVYTQEISIGPGSWSGVELSSTYAGEIRILSLKEITPTWVLTGTDSTDNHPMLENGAPQFIPDRADSTAYITGDRVNFAGIYATCITAGTSGTYVLGEYGSEEIANGDFSSWTSDNPDNWSTPTEDANNYITEVSSGARFVSDGTNLYIYQTGVLTIGTTYKLRIEVKNTTGYLKVSAPSPYIGPLADGVTTVDFVAAYESLTIGRYSGATDCTIVSISIKEVIPLTRDGDDTSPATSDGDFINDGTTLVWRRDGRYQDRVGYLSEEARTNSLKGSCLFEDGTYWSGNADFTITEVDSIIDGQKAWKHTDSGSYKKRGQVPQATLTDGETVIFSVMLENIDVGVSRLLIRNSTDSYYPIQTEYNWSTGIAAVVGGSGTITATPISMVGPNEGEVVKFSIGYQAITSDDGDSMEAIIYPNFTTTPSSIIIHHAQFEVGSFATSPIITTSAAVTRPATKLIIPSTGVLRSNDFAVNLVIIPEGTGQTSYIIGSYTDANNYTAIKLTATTIELIKRISGTSYTATSTYTHATGTPIHIQAFLDSDDGIGIRTRVWSSTAWGSFTAWNEDSTTTNIAVPTNLEVGSLNSASQFSGVDPIFQIHFTPNPKTWLEENQIYCMGVQLTSSGVSLMADGEELRVIKNCA